MAKLVLDNSIVTINGVNLSTYARSGEWTLSRPEYDVSGMGAPFVEWILGKPDVRASIVFMQDYAAGTVDATLWGVAQTDTPFAISWRIDNSAISTSNPEYQMTVLLPEYQPIAGGQDSATEVTASFLNAATTGLVRDVTP